ncbi:MAG TPA: MFS transporter, partial [Kiloniellales bacterium]|nr:MFS transporter [Kiloniellales bacterium]
GSEELVNLVYVGGSIASMLLTLCLPAIYARLPRPLVFMIGTVLMVLAPLLIALDQPVALIVGLAAQLCSVALIEISLNLYVLDHVERKNLTRFEPLRMSFSAASWTAGPWLGIKAAELQPELPFYLSSGAALVLLLFFLWLRPAVRARAVGASLFANVGRFVEQPRLRLAWALAFARSTWWVLFFVNGQIYLVEVLGFDEETAAALSSLVMAATFLVPLWGWIGRRIGMRRLLWIGYGLSGLVTLSLAVLAHPAWLAAALLVLAGIVTSLIDGAGNVPFLRAVKPSQRSRMTAVFMTYRDASQLIPPAIFSGLLAIFSFGALFAAVGALMLGMTVLVRHIPRRM